MAAPSFINPKDLPSMDVTESLMEAAEDDASEDLPTFPLLWDAVPHTFYDVEDRYNLGLNVEGKGPYISALREDTLKASHRQFEPFPLRSVLAPEVVSRLEEPTTCSPHGFSLPFLTGQLRGDGTDPMTSEVEEYWHLRKSAESSLRFAQRCRRQSNYYKARQPPMQQQELLELVRDPGVKRLPSMGLQLGHVLTLTRLLSERPFLRGWDTKHNWLYGGGCLAVLDDPGRIVHVTGDHIAVAELKPCESSGSCPLAVHPEPCQRLSAPGGGAVLQLHSSGATLAARTGVEARLYMPDAAGRLTEADAAAAAAAAVPLTAVAAAAGVAWACVDAAGRLVVRDARAGAAVTELQLPDVLRPVGWFGLDAGPGPGLYQAASWEQLYTVDTRAPSPTVVFRLSDNRRLFAPGDRLHAVRRSASRRHLCLLASSRHLTVLDDRFPSTPYLRSRLMVPPAPLFLASAAWRPGAELVCVAAPADQHPQCVVYDWEAGAELGGGRLLGCSRPPLERRRRAGLEAERRLELSLASLTAQVLDDENVQVYTANSWGDVAVHPLTSRPAALAREEARQRRTKVRRAVGKWSRAVERQRRLWDGSRPLPCATVRAWSPPLTELLAAAPEPTPPPPVGDVAPWRLWWTGRAVGTGSDLSSDPSDIESLLSDWETDTGANTESDGGRLSVAEEMEQALYDIAGSRRRARQRRWGRRPRYHSSESAAPSSSRATTPERPSTPASPAPRQARSGGSVTPPAPSPGTHTPARPPPATTPSSFSRFNMNMFDD